MLALVPDQVEVRLLLEVLELLFGNVLPYATHLLHDVKRRNVRVILYHLGTCLSRVRIELSELTSLTKSM